MRHKSPEISLVERLVADSLAKLGKPCSDRVTDDVFCAIESCHSLRTRYDELVAQGGRSVNSRIGRTVREQTGRRTGPRTNSPRSSLIRSYSKLQAKKR